MTVTNGDAAAPGGRERRALIAVNPFKGTLTGADVAAACARAARSEGYHVDVVPASDGGDGLLESLRAAGAGARETRYRVPGPLGAMVWAPVLWLDRRHAVVESRFAVGLGLMPAARRSPLAATTRGLGELIGRVADDGAERIYVGLGGSGTMDGGLGMARAWGWTPRGGDGLPLPDAGRSLAEMAALEPGDGPRAELVGLADVRHPLLGPGGARVFARQKGADAAGEALLASGLERLVRLTVDRGSRDLARCPGAGAAGGLGFGILLFGGGSLRPGAPWLLDRVGFDPLLRRATVAVTAEGAFDETSMAGKLTGEVLERARRAGVPAVLVAPRARAVPGGTVAESGDGVWNADGVEAAARRALRRLGSLPPP